MQNNMALHAIIIGEKSKAHLQYVQSIQAIAGKGLEADRYFYGQGTFNKPPLSQDVLNLSILPYEALAECNARLQSDLDFLDLRRNLIIENFDADVLGDKVFTLGTAQFKIVRTCPPCRYLSRVLNKDMLIGLKYIGGVRATVIQTDIISINEQIIESFFKNLI